VIDGGARILGELLRTPRIVKTARIVLGNLDPEAAPALVRTIMYADSMLFFDVVTAAPALANAAVLGAREVCEQVLTLPEELLRRFVPRLLEEVSGEQLGEAAGLAVLAVGRVVSSPDGLLALKGRAFESDFKRGVAKGLSRDREMVGRQVAWLADTIVRVARENPRLMAQVVRPLVTACQQALEERDDA